MPERADGSVRWRVRRALKVAVADALVLSGADQLVRAWLRRQAGGVRVLVVSYHRVTHDFEACAQDGLPSMLVSTRTLRLHLEQLARTRELVPLAEARRLLAEPPARGPVRDVAAITFDDGYADLHGIALPIVAALRIPATAFVVTGYVGTGRRLPHDRLYAALAELAARGLDPRQAGLGAPHQRALDACEGLGPGAALDRLIAGLPPRALLALADALAARVGQGEGDLPPETRLMDWEDLREVQAAGIELGGHTASHAVLPLLPAAEARREIEACRDAIRERTGSAPRMFAYPNGYHTAAVRRLVAQAGFEGAVTTEDHENVRGGDPYRLRRKMLWENTTLGPRAYSPALAACSLEGVFHALRLSRAVLGEYGEPSGLAGGGPQRRWGEGRQPLLRGAAARSREAASTAQGPAEQGWGPDGFAGGAGRHAP